MKQNFTDKSYETPAGQVYKVKIGGLETTDDVVKRIRVNGFECVGRVITQENFPLEHRSTKEIEIEVIDPGRPFTEDEGLLFLKNAGLKRPTHEHAIRFTEQCGVKTNGKYVVFLHKQNNGHVLYLNHKSEIFNAINPENGFGNECVLAGVRR